MIDIQEWLNQLVGDELPEEFDLIQKDLQRGS